MWYFVRDEVISVWSSRGTSRGASWRRRYSSSATASRARPGATSGSVVNAGPW